MEKKAVKRNKNLSEEPPATRKFCNAIKPSLTENSATDFTISIIIYISLEYKPTDTHKHIYIYVCIYLYIHTV